ncbi:MAG: serine--tRNA ligase, partial [Thermomicrobiales bacterium]
MLDIRIIREQPDLIKAAIATLNTSAPIDEILALDERRRTVLTEVEHLKAQRNEGSKTVNSTKDKEERDRLIGEMRSLGGRITILDDQAKVVDMELSELMLQVPNLPLPEVPVGPDETANVIAAQHGEIPAFDFEPKPHWELGESLGIIDFERGVKVSGSRFYVLRGDGARLQRALITWMLDLHTQKHGYQEVLPPYIVLPEMLVGTGQLPKFADAQ